MAWPTTIRTWLAGETPTDVMFNEQIRDPLKAIGDAWGSYSPTWTAATTNPTTGNGSVTGRYSRAGKLVHFRIAVAFGTTTTFGSGAMTLTVPVAPVTGHRFAFAGWLLQGSALYEVNGHCNGSTTLNLYTPHATTPAQRSSLTATVPVTMTAATGNGIYVNGTYEAA